MVNVNTEENGRYTEIYIDGVQDGSVAFDEETNELIVSDGPDSSETHQLEERWDE